MRHFLVVFTIILAVSSYRMMAQAESIVVAHYEGQFTTKSGKDGNLRFILFDDGAMEGAWGSESGLTVIEVKGFYVLKRGVLIFSGCGEATFPSGLISRVLMNAAARGEGNALKGTFRAILESSTLIDEEGEWQVKLVPGQMEIN